MQVVDLEINKELPRIEFNSYCYINSRSVVDKLINYDNWPIEKKKAIKNTLQFLSWLDTKHKILETTLIPIDSKKLCKFFYRRYYKRYMDILSELEILTNVTYEDGTWFNKGSKFKLYRIHNSYFNPEKLCFVIFDGKPKMEFNTDLDLDPRFIKTIKELEIDYPNAIKDELDYYLKGKTTFDKFRIRVSMMFNVRERRYIKKGKRVNRIYHSFSNLSRITRKYLTIKLSNIDIKNCQPLLLSSFMKMKNIDYESKYQEVCELGMFYESFIDLQEIGNREMVKEEIYKNIFFGFNKKNEYNKRFKELYPKVWSFLEEQNEEFKNGSDQSLALYLQNIEARLFNDLIPKRSKYYFTLFDAIYYSDERDTTELLNLIQGFFRNLDINPKTEIEL